MLAPLAALLAILAVPARVAAQAISAADAAAHVGEEVTVEGEVPAVVCSPLACLLSFTPDYSGLVASIPGDVKRTFPPPKETYAMHRVRVHGVVVNKNGRPRIEVRNPADLQVIDRGNGGRAPVVLDAPLSGDDGGGVGPATAAQALASPGGATIPAERTEAATAPPVVDAPPPDVPRQRASRSRVIDPGQITTHVGGPRAPEERPRGESLVARLTGDAGDAAAVEASSLRQEVAKLEQQNAELRDAVVALDQRLAALEQAQGARLAGTGAAAMPETHDYVVSADDSNRLAHVTRGWNSERVLRVLGAPLNTVTEANGFMVWYYSNGRAITLDARGRVVSSIGF